MPANIEARPMAPSKPIVLPTGQEFSPVPAQNPARPKLAPERTQVQPHHERRHAHRPERIEFEKGDNTSVHEVLHAIVLSELGYRASEISVMREGNSMGRVTVDGRVHPLDFQVFAAASSIKIPGYEPAGFGHDHFQINQIASRGGFSVFEAQQKAADIISRYPPELIHKAANILRGVGAVNGSINGILARAQSELNRERSMNKAEPVFMNFARENVVEEAQPDKPKELTTFETLTEDRMRITWIVDGQTMGQWTTCSRCGGKDGAHRDFCRHFRKDVLTGETVPGEITEEKKETFKPEVPEATSVRTIHEGPEKKTRHKMKEGRRYNAYTNTEPLTPRYRPNMS